jgi:hypothetical protein
MGEVFMSYRRWPGHIKKLLLIFALIIFCLSLASQGEHYLDDIGLKSPKTAALLSVPSFNWSATYRFGTVNGFRIGMDKVEAREVLLSQVDDIGGINFSGLPAGSPIWLHFRLRLGKGLTADDADILMASDLWPIFYDRFGNNMEIYFIDGKVTLVRRSYQNIELP